MKGLIILFLSVCFLSFYLLSAAENFKDPKTLFEKTCSSCHSLDVSKKQRLTKDEWQDIIKRMKIYGLIISEEDEKIVLKYLSTTYGVK